MNERTKVFAGRTAPFPAEEAIVTSSVGAQVANEWRRRIRGVIPSHQFYQLHTVGAPRVALGICRARLVVCPN